MLLVYFFSLIVNLYKIANQRMQKHVFLYFLMWSLMFKVFLTKAKEKLQNTM